MILPGHLTAMLEYWALEMTGVHYYNGRIVQVTLKNILEWFCSCFGIRYSTTYYDCVRRSRTYRSAQHSFSRPRQDEVQRIENMLNALPHKAKGATNIRKYVQRAGRRLLNGRADVQ